MQSFTTPSPSAHKSARITDYFPWVKQSGQVEKAKRELDDTSAVDTQPAKRQKRHEDDSTSTNLRTVPLNVDVDTPNQKVDTPKRKRKTPASARLLDDTDGGLRDSFVGRWDFREETSAEEDASSEHKRPRSSVPVQAPASVNSLKRKRPASSRLLDDVDGGLSDSLVGRFETPRYAEQASIGEVEKENKATTHYTVDDNNLDDDSEAETIRVDASEDDMSSDEDRNDDGYHEGGCGKGGNSEGDDTDDDNKENVPTRVRYRTPSPQRLPTITQDDTNQGREAADSSPRTPSNEPSDTPSSLLLPSPVVDLPPLPSSSSSSSSLVPAPPSTMLSPPSSP